MPHFTRRLPTHIVLLSFTCFVATDITLVKHSFMVKINSKSYASYSDEWNGMDGTKKSGWKESYICGCCQYYVRSLISQLALRNHRQVHNVNQLWACYYYFLFIENTFGLAFRYYLIILINLCRCSSSSCLQLFHFWKTFDAQDMNEN